MGEADILLSLFLCQFPQLENVYNDNLLGWFLLWFNISAKDSVWHSKWFLTLSH